MSAPELPDQPTANRPARARQPRQHSMDAVEQPDNSIKSAKLRAHNRKSADAAAFRKVSVTVPDSVLEEARRRAGARGLSAYVTEAVEAQLAIERLQDLVLELDAQFGPVPDAMVAEAAAAWPGR